MKILITGGSSLLGKYLLKTAPVEHCLEATWYSNHVGLPMYQMDVGDKSQVRYVFDRVKPEIVIHCAANGSVDYAEKNYQEVRQVNVTGTENVLWSAEEYKAKVIYISTNAVFEGVNPPYSEDSPQQPVNSYGLIKKQAEQAVKQSKRWLILRPFLLYGWPWDKGRGNWVTLTIDRLRQEKPLKLVNDVVWQPTYAGDMAKAIWKLLEVENEVFNVAARDRMTLYELGVKVADAWGLDSSLIEPVGSDYFQGIARRPYDTSYDLRKLDGTGVEMSGIETGLKLTKAEANE